MLSWYLVYYLSPHQTCYKLVLPWGFEYSLLREPESGEAGHICHKLELVLSLALCQKQTIVEPARVSGLYYFISPEMFTRGLLPNWRSIKLLNHYIFCCSQLAKMWFWTLTVRYFGSVHSQKCLLMFICIRPWRLPWGADSTCKQRQIYIKGISIFFYVYLLLLVMSCTVEVFLCPVGAFWLSVDKISLLF